MYSVLKSIRIIKRKHWWSLTSSCQTMFREDFRLPMSFKEKKSIDTLLLNYELIFCIDVYMYICYDTVDLFKMISTPSSLKLVGFSLPFLH